MKLNLLNTTLLLAGIILIYAAIKDIDPRDVIKNTLQGKPSSGKAERTPGDVLLDPKTWGTIPQTGTMRPSGHATQQA